jgi:hypothetical protein
MTVEHTTTDDEIVCILEYRNRRIEMFKTHDHLGEVLCLASAAVQLVDALIEQSKDDVDNLLQIFEEAIALDINVYIDAVDFEDIEWSDPAWWSPDPDQEVA